MGGTGPEVRAALERIAGNDPNQSVRDAASEILEDMKNNPVQDRQLPDGDDSAARRGAPAHELDQGEGQGLEADSEHFMEEAQSRNGISPLGMSMAELVQALDGDPDQAELAARELRQRGSDAVPALAWALDGDSALLRRRAAQVLADLGPKGSGARAALTRALSDVDARVREQAARALGRLGAAGMGALSQLTRALGDGDPLVRTEAARSLDLLERELPDAVPHLAAVVRSGPDAARVAACSVLGRTGPKAGQAVSALAEALTMTNPEVRAGAARALGRIGPISISALTPLRALRQDPDAGVREAARQALLAIDPTNSIPGSVADGVDSPKGEAGQAGARSGNPEAASPGPSPSVPPGQTEEAWPTSLADLEPDPRYPDFAPLRPQVPSPEAPAVSPVPPPAAPGGPLVPSVQRPQPPQTDSPESPKPVLPESAAPAAPDAPHSPLARVYEQARRMFRAGQYAGAAQALERGAARDHSPSQVLLGVLYREGRGVRQDNQQALRWFRHASALGDAAGYFNMGWMYEHGLGVEPDKDAARRWYGRAAKRGHGGARERLQQLTAP
jgi:HEAT repeat protein